MSPMDSNVPIPVVVVRGTSPTSLNTQLPRSDPFGNVTHNDLRSGSSSGLFQGWNAYCFTDTQQRDQEDGDDSMASGSPPPSSFDPSSPGNLDFGGRSGLSAMSDMRLRDESTSPMPGLLTPVGEESDVIADLPDQPAGIFEMELLDYEAMTYPWPNCLYYSWTDRWEFVC